MLDKVLKPTLSLFVICIFVTTVLVFTNLVTNSKIKKQNLENEMSTIKSIVPNAENFIKQDDYYIAKNKQDNIIGYIFKSETKGYSGEIEILTGISNEGEIIEVKIISQNETPGLGANVTKDSFLDQFKNKISNKNLKINEDVQAVTGATISSKAVTESVNKSLERYNLISEGEK